MWMSTSTRSTCGRGALRADDGVAVRAEVVLEHFAHVRLVVDDQDRRFRARTHRAPPRHARLRVNRPRGIAGDRNAAYPRWGGRRIVRELRETPIRLCHCASLVTTRECPSGSISRKA